MGQNVLTKAMLYQNVRGGYFSVYVSSSLSALARRQWLLRWFGSHVLLYTSQMIYASLFMIEAHTFSRASDPPIGGSEIGGAPNL